MQEQEKLRKLENSEYILRNEIKLRKLKEDDADDMYEYTSNEESCAFLKWGPHTQLQQAYEFILKRLEHKEIVTDLLWGIELIEANKLIGVVRVYHIDLDKKQAEISYILNPLYSGKGYATTAVKKIMSVCFEALDLEKIVAFYVEENRKSEKLLKRCGAVDDNEWEERVEIKNKLYQMHKCVVLKDR